MSRQMLPVWVLTGLLLLSLVAPAAAQSVTLEDVRDAIAAQGASWTAADNEVARLHREQGWYAANLSLPILTGKEQYFTPLGTEDLPTHFDWRDIDGKNYVTKVKNQQSCGSCWAFATTGPIEAHIAIQEDWPDMDINLSEQMLVSCCHSVGCNGCDGGFTTSSFDFAVTPGLVDEECFPYKQNDSEPCDDKCGDWADRVFKIDSWEVIGEGAFGALLPKPEEIMAALQYGPLGVGLVIYPDFYDYESGIYTTVVGVPEGFHAVTLVGYDSVEGYWICKNSWGSFWGEDGYFRIKWGAAFIGAFSILPHYTAQGLNPGDDDDDTPADDDASDDDTGENDDDDDDKTTPTPEEKSGDDDDDNDSGGCA